MLHENCADFLGHAYGSNSKNYKDAIKRVDNRIGDVVDWIRKEKGGDDTAVIVCSDDGMHNIDHSYLLFDSEKYDCYSQGKFNQTFER